MYIDEGKRNDYLLVAVMIDNADISSTRKVMKEMRVTGSERIHFVRESKGQKRKVLTKLAALGIRTHIFKAKGLSDRDARDWCLKQVLGLAISERVDRIVFELDESTLQADKRCLDREIKSRVLGNGIRYEHIRARNEPLLWVPDAVAWSFGRGEEWAPLVAPLIERVVPNYD